MVTSLSSSEQREPVTAASPVIRNSASNDVIAPATTNAKYMVCNNGEEMTSATGKPIFHVFRMLRTWLKLHVGGRHHQRK